MKKDYLDLLESPTDRVVMVEEPEGCVRVRETEMKKHFKNKIDRNLVTYMKWKINGGKR